MRGLRDSRMRLMFGGAYLLVGVVLCVMFGPELVTLVRRPGFRVSEFLTKDHAFDVGLWSGLAIALVVGGWRLLARAK